MFRNWRSALLAIVSLILLPTPSSAQHVAQQATAATDSAPTGVGDLGSAEGAITPHRRITPKTSIVPGGPAEPDVFTAPLVYLCDSAGRLGTIDLDSKAVRVIGRMGVVLTDIGFAPGGSLYGVSFSQLYRVNPKTAKVTRVGAGLGVAGINALTFNRNGQAIAASFSRRGFYLINTATGRASYGGDNGPFTSAGDFAYDGTHLYFAAAGKKLVDYDFATLRYVARPVALNNLFGLVVPQKGVLIGFAGTKAYRLNPATGANTLHADLTGKGLSQIFGAASKSFF